MKSYVDDIIRRSELLARVMNGEQLSKADAADIFKVSEITINRDLRALRENGIRIYSKKNNLILEEAPIKSTLISIASDYLPLKLNSDVFHKQVKVYSKSDNKDFFTKLILVSKAVEEGLAIELVYKRFDDNKVVDYKLYPVRLVNVGLNWILHAFKVGEDVIKSFYLSRIQKLTLTNKKFSKLSLPKEDKKLYDIELKFDHRVRDEILDKIWFDSFELKEIDGYIILKTRQSISNSLAGWCISWWDTMEILQPAELLDYIKEMESEFNRTNNIKWIKTKKGSQ
ncbi:MAG: WYL domain-containing protein [Bacteroidetes bacterium]|nr:WYL domain-containing protein [Bacteroidota bacterium]